MITLKEQFETQPKIVQYINPYDNSIHYGLVLEEGAWHYSVYILKSSPTIAVGFGVGKQKTWSKSVITDIVPSDLLVLILQNLCQ